MHKSESMDRENHRAGDLRVGRIKYIIWRNHVGYYITQRPACRLLYLLQVFGDITALRGINDQHPIMVSNQYFNSLLAAINWLMSVYFPLIQSHE
jgi:hypothetical protein